MRPELRAAPDTGAGVTDDRGEFDRLFASVYPELRQLARRHLRGERAGHTLVTTALVHEAYLKVEHRHGVPSEDRAKFLAFISAAMRRILVDHARRRSAGKRGGGAVCVTLQPGMASVEPQSTDLLALDDALARLGERDARLERVVECRFFGGLTAEETASALGVSLRTVERDWMRARAYLHDMLGAGAS